MAIHDTGMFTVKEINHLKILQDVIDRNMRPGQAAEMHRCFTASFNTRRDSIMPLRVLGVTALIPENAA